MDIENIIDQMRETGLVRDGHFSIAANLSRDFKVSIFREEGDALLVKFFPAETGNSDYATVTAIKTVLGDHVIAPEALFQTADCSATVTPYVAHEPILAADIEQPALFGQIASILLSLNQAAPRSGLNLPHVSLEMITAYLDRSPLLNNESVDYLRTLGQELISPLPTAMQHCDFTFTNLGVDPTGTLIVFDWEDYGQLDFCGFDLATFLASYFHHKELNPWISQSPENLISFLYKNLDKPFFLALGITAEQYAKMLPGYLLIFFYLKESLGYGAIGIRTLNFFHDIVATKSWREFLGYA